MLWTLIVGGFIGFFAGKIAKRSDSMGLIYKIFAGLAGSFIGEKLFSNFGPHLAGMAIIPSIIGAVIVIILVSYFTDGNNNRR